jgi:hypothetical protein
MVPVAAHDVVLHESQWRKFTGNDRLCMFLCAADTDHAFRSQFVDATQHVMLQFRVRADVPCHDAAIPWDT